MQTNQAKQLFLEADTLIQRAEYELNRADEDVVPHQICSSTRIAIANYLQSFLMRNGRAIPDTTNLDHLLQICAKEDDRFSELNLSTIDCRANFEDHSYCSNMNKLQECFTLAQKTRSLTMQDKWPKSVRTK